MRYRPATLILIALMLGVSLTGASAAAPDGKRRTYLPLIAGRVSAPGGWTTLLDEGFEAAPAAGWRSLDGNGQTAGEYYWAGRTCRPLSGRASAWAAGGGRDGAGLACGSAYPDNADSWMIYGPFSLAGAQMAQLRFSFYLADLAAGDAFCWGASADYVVFTGQCLDAAPGGWSPFVLDLGNLAGDQPPSISFLGQPQVWIAFRFTSDATAHAAEGVYVDNVIVRKCPDRTCANPPAAAPALRTRNSRDLRLEGAKGHG